MENRKTISVVVCFLAVLLLSNIAHANLILMGQGTSVHGTYNLIYDTDLDITWYDFTRTAGMGDIWVNQMNWATGLSVIFASNTYDDWRLPITFNRQCTPYNCTNSDILHGDWKRGFSISRLWFTKHGWLSESTGWLLLVGDWIFKHPERCLALQSVHQLPVKRS